MSIEKFSGVDFLKVGRTAQILEIALLKLGTLCKGRYTPLKSFSKVGQFMKSTPGHAHARQKKLG